MTHSPEHLRQKAEARKEALDHFYNSNAMEPRNGMNHDDHKFAAQPYNGEDEQNMSYKVKIGESC